MDGYSSYHHVFGRDPYVASDLLQGPIDVIAATQPLYDSGAERSSAIRMAARKAALEPKTVTTFGAPLQHGHDQLNSSQWETRWLTGAEARVKVSNKEARDGTAEQQWSVSRATTSSCLIETTSSAAPLNKFRHATLAEVTGDTLVEDVLRGAQEVLQQGGQQGMIDLTQADRPPKMETVHDVAKKNALGESSQSHPAPTLSSPEQGTEHIQMGVDNDVCAGPSMAIDDDDEHPSVDESITQIETTTEPLDGPRQQNDDCGPSCEYLPMSALCRCAQMMLARWSMSCLRIGRASGAGSSGKKPIAISQET